jgi:hypothetical protein
VQISADKNSTWHLPYYGEGGIKPGHDDLEGHIKGYGGLQAGADELAANLKSQGDAIISGGVSKGFGEVARKVLKAVGEGLASIPQLSIEDYVKRATEKAEAGVWEKRGERLKNNPELGAFTYAPQISFAAAANFVEAIQPPTTYVLRKAKADEAMGRPLEGSGKADFTTLEDAISVAVRAGHIPGKTLGFVENGGGKVTFYAPTDDPAGPQAKARGGGSYRLDKPYSVEKAVVGEPVGAPLKGSGMVPWTPGLTPEEAVAIAVQSGHAPAKTLFFVQKIKGTVHFFGKGAVSTVAASVVAAYKMSPPAADAEVKTHVPQWGQRGSYVFGSPGDMDNPVSEGNGLLGTKLKIALPKAAAWCGAKADCVGLCHNAEGSTWFYAEAKKGTAGTWTLPVRPEAATAAIGRGWKCLKREERGEFTFGNPPATSALSGKLAELSNVKIEEARAKCAANTKCGGLCHNSAATTWLYRTSTKEWSLPAHPNVFQGYAHSSPSDPAGKKEHVQPDPVGCFAGASKPEQIFGVSRSETLEDRVPSVAACAQACEDRGFALAALISGGEQCVCADEVAKGTKPLKSNRCTATCDTGGDLPCGGAGTTDKHMSVYRVSKLWQCEVKAFDKTRSRGVYTFPVTGKGSELPLVNGQMIKDRCASAPKAECSGYCHNKDGISYTYTSNLLVDEPNPMEVRDVDSMENGGGEKWNCFVRGSSANINGKPKQIGGGAEGKESKGAEGKEGKGMEGKESKGAESKGAEGKEGKGMEGKESKSAEVGVVAPPPCNCIPCGQSDHGFDTGACGAVSATCSATAPGPGCYTDNYDGCNCVTRKGVSSAPAAMRFSRPVSDDGLRGGGGRVGGLEGIEIDTPQNTKAMLRGLPAEEGAVVSHESASVVPADSSHDDLDLAIEAQARKELKLGLGAVR